MIKSVSGRTALVTGASRSIGAAIAIELAAQGAAVGVNYCKSKSAADGIVARIQSTGGTAVAVGGDVTRADDVEAMVAETVRALGPLTTLVNNAGSYQFLPFNEVTLEQFRRDFDLNVFATLMVTQKAIKHFHADGGSVVNVSSIAARRRTPLTALYASSKAAVEALTSVMSKELASRKIRVNAVSPNAVMTEGLVAAGLDNSAFRQRIADATPLKRFATVEDIASAVAFLASDAASYMTGEIIAVAGGIA